MPDCNDNFVYRITVGGKLQKRWADWFDGMTITHREDETVSPVSVLEGPVADQAALRGLLTKLWDLNLDLIAIQRFNFEMGKEDRHE